MNLPRDTWLQILSELQVYRDTLRRSVRVVANESGLAPDRAPAACLPAVVDVSSLVNLAPGASALGALFGEDAA